MVDFSDLDDLDSAPVRPDRTAGQPQPAGTAPAMMRCTKCSGSGQTRAVQDLCSGISAIDKQHLEVQGAGHYGIFSGRRWREMVYPQVKAFILAHDTTVAAGSKPVTA